MEKKRKHISAFQQNDKEYDFLCDKVRYDGTFRDSTEAEEFIRVLIGIIDALDPYPMKVVDGKIVDIPTDAVFRRNGGNYEIGKVFEQINANACWFDKPRKWWKLNLQMYIDKKLWIMKWIKRTNKKRCYKKKYLLGTNAQFVQLGGGKKAFMEQTIAPTGTNTKRNSRISEGQGRRPKPFPPNRPTLPNSKP